MAGEAQLAGARHLADPLGHRIVAPCAAAAEVSLRRVDAGPRGLMAGHAVRRRGVVLQVTSRAVSVLRDPQVGPQGVAAAAAEVLVVRVVEGEETKRAVQRPDTDVQGADDQVRFARQGGFGVALCAVVGFMGAVVARPAILLGHQLQRSVRFAGAVAPGAAHQPVIGMGEARGA